jgi:hypothetical protein
MLNWNMPADTPLLGRRDLAIYSGATTVEIRCRAADEPRDDEQ